MNNPTYKKLLETSLTQLNTKNPNFGLEEWKFTQILNVETQVVAGINYKITVELINTNSKTQKMILIIFYQPWTETIVLTRAVTLKQSGRPFLYRYYIYF